MRQHDTRTVEHVLQREALHAPVLREPRKRASIPRMEEGARKQPHHGFESRPFQMPPQKAAHKSYTIRNLVCALLTVAVLFGVIWSYGAIYQVGYKAAENYYQQEEVQNAEG